MASGLFATLFVLGCASDGERKLVPPERPDRGEEHPDEVHAAIFRDDPYPSATACRTCHEDHYREWSASPHAYAQISPVFNAMHGTILKKTNGTFGDFCIRCHTPVGMALGEKLFDVNANRSEVSLEGVTCIVCHRVNQDFGKNSGRNALLPGGLFEPVYGPRDGEELQRVLADSETYRALVTEPGQPGRKIHAEAREFFAITTPAFCGRCHDVTFINGFRLEEAFSEYKQSPAAARGETCQDCHMGTTPGVANGYATGPAAVIGGVPTAPRKRTNHRFAGPDHSVVHPGIFPHNPEAKELATTEEWVLFDHEAGWGTDDFEDLVDESYEFPERWEWPEDRYEAREILDEQIALLEEAYAEGTALLRQGYRLGEVRTTRFDEDGLAFVVEVRNGTDGHNAPTGFIAERVVFLQVDVVDAAGEVLFRSGDLDPNGDVRDLHSLYVHDHELPLDTFLFSLQSKFVTRNLRGGEREQVLAVNESIDPLPFARPDTSPSILLGRTQSARIHKQSIEPLGRRLARYRVDPDALTGELPYRISVRLVAGMVPPNLIHAISEVGFDYGMSARDVADAVVDGQRVLWEKELVVEGEAR